MPIAARSQVLTQAIMNAIAQHVSGGQLRQLSPAVEEAIKITADKLDKIEIDARAGSMALGSKFQQFIAAFLPPTAPQNQALFAQACFLAGAHSSFQILAHAATKSREESVVIWTDLQNEIKGAVPKRENLVELPPEKQIIV